MTEKERNLLIAAGVISPDEPEKEESPEYNWNPIDLFESAVGWAGGKVDRGVEFAQEKWQSDDNPLRQMRNESLAREREEFQLEKKYDPERFSDFVGPPEPSAEIEEKPIDWIGHFSNTDATKNYIEKRIKKGPLGDWSDATPREKADFIRWKEEKDRGVLPAIFNSPESSVVGKGLQALGITELHPSGYQYQPQTLPEKLAHTVGSIATDAPVFAAGGAIGGLATKGLPAIAGKIATGGMAFGTHGAAGRALDDVNAGLPVDLASAGIEGLKGFGMGAAIGGGAALIERVASGVGKSVYAKNIERAVKRKAVNRNEVIEDAVNKALRAEKVTKTALDIPAETALMTGVSAALHGDEITKENFILNLATIGTLRTFRAIPKAERILKEVARERNLVPGDIAEQMNIERKVLVDILKSPESAKAFIEESAKKAQEVKKDKAESFDIREMMRRGSQPKIREKIDSSVQTMLDSIDRLQDPVSIYNDFGNLDKGSLENPDFVNLKPRYQQEVLRKVQAELTRRYDPDYHDIMTQLNDFEYEVFRNIENEYKSYDNQPEWGRWSKAEYDSMIAEKATERRTRIEKTAAQTQVLKEIEAKRREVVRSDIKEADKAIELEKLQAKEREILGQNFVTEDTAREIRQSFSEDPAILKIAEDVAAGNLKSETTMDEINRAYKLFNKTFVTSRGAMVAKETKAGALMDKVIKNMRLYEEQYAANWMQDFDNAVKKYTPEEQKQAIRFLDLTPERYNEVAGQPSERVVQLATELDTINKSVVAELKKYGLTVEELQTYYRHVIKPEFQEGGKNRAEFLEWMGEELQRMYPDSKVEVDYALDAKKANIERALEYLKSKTDVDSSTGKYEKMSSFQITREFKNMPEKFYYTEKPVEIMMEYFEDAGNRVARARAFGADDSILKNLLIDINMEAGTRYDPRTAEGIMKRAVDLADTVSNRNRPTDLESQWLANKIINFEIVSKMGLSQLGQITQMLEPLVHSSAKSYFKALSAMSGISKTMTREQAKEFSNRATSSLRVAHKTILGSLYGESTTGQGFLKLTKFRSADIRSRYIGIMTGLFHAEALVDKVNTYDAKTLKLADRLNTAGSWRKFNKMAENSGLRLSAGEKMSIHRARMFINRMERVDMSLGKLSKDANGKYFLTEADKMRMARQMEVNTNYRAHFEDLPEIFNKSPWMRVLTQFKSFSYEKTKHTIRDVVWQEAKMGNLLPMTKLLIAAGIGAQPVILARSLISGRDLPKDAWDWIWKSIGVAGTLGTFEWMLSTINYKDTHMGAAHGDALSLIFGIVDSVKKKETPDKFRHMAGVAASYTPIWGRTLKDIISGKREVEGIQDVFPATKLVTDGLPEKFWDKTVPDFMYEKPKTAADYYREAGKKYSSKYREAAKKYRR